MKIVVIGADGQLGSDLCRVIDKDDLVPLTIKDIDITEFESVRSSLSAHHPEAVINTAAYHRVDDCENNDIEAYRVNSHGARNLALVCKEIGAVLVHLSTDYVFSGEKGSPYSEENDPDPKTAYGISKLAGEQFVKYILKNSFIVRSCGLYGAAGCLGKGGGNFVENMLRRAKEGQKLKVVTDEVVGPTYTKDLALKILELIGTGKFGLYHITNSGQCSWWEFADAIFRSLKKDIKIEKTSAKEFKTKAHRPKYSVLENAALKKIGLQELRPWRQALKAYLEEKRYLK